MSLSLTKRSTNGAPLTATQHDANMTAIETAVNQNTTDIDVCPTLTELNAMFAAQSGGKQQVDWANVTGKPNGAATRYAFCANKTDADQTVTANGTIVVSLNTEDFDTGSCFASSKFTAPVTGYYQFDAAIQVAINSGAPTANTVIASLRVNGAAYTSSTYASTSDTGTRVYRISRAISLTAADTVDLMVDFSFSGTGTWAVKSTGQNTFLSGFLIQ